MIWLAAAEHGKTWIDVAGWAIIAAAVVGLYYIWAKYGGGVDERAEAADRLRRKWEADTDGR